ncbi:hypothetical protein ABIB38_002247 [Massilia sp. UYP11]|uniref:hypothetical protein n=1 Tax=Massilia sp. UYP11 TaxID=1756385 RepID=UPI003D1E5939
MSRPRKEDLCFGQLVFLESLESSEFRPRLARAALNLGGLRDEYPIDLGEIVRRLPWRECQSVLALASLAASAPFSWPESQKKMLMEWAASPFA